MAFCISSTFNLSSALICQYHGLLISKGSPTRISNSTQKHVQKQIHCNATPELNTSTIVRRSGNYQPGIWDEDYLLSLTNEYTGDTYRKKAEKLTEKVRMIINNVDKDNPLDQLELVDNLQRLGLAYHFESEIKKILDSIHNNNDDKWKQGNLHATSLEFRLFRQHGYNVSEEVFSYFKDKTGSFKAFFCDDVKAMLSFYEASHYGFAEESIMEEAWQFTSKRLKELDDKDVDQNMAVLVKNALALPLHWWAPRVATRWFIDLYERSEDKNHLLLELAKLDFNIVQAIHQEDLNHTLRWWKNSGLGKLAFVRNRLVTSYLWAVGVAPEPQYSHCRRVVGKAIALITILDDIYDVYGTLPELELFTDAVERWDIKAMKQLPSYMKTSFLALYNYCNEIVYDVLKEQDVEVVQTLIKTWTRVMHAYMVEVNWYLNQSKPTLEGYMKNAYITITGPAIAILAYLSSKNKIIQKELEFLESDPDLVYWSSWVFRLQDDLGTSSDEMKRGDVPKSVQCYMNETGCSEEAAREHVKDLMRQIWKKMNVHRTPSNCPLPKNSMEMILNLTRISHCVYLHGDGHGIEGQEIKDVLMSLFFQPIPLFEIESGLTLIGWRVLASYI